MLKFRFFSNNFRTKIPKSIHSDNSSTAACCSLHRCIPLHTSSEYSYELRYSAAAVSVLTVPRQEQDTGLNSVVAAVYVLDVLWGQPIKLIQVASNSELREYQWKDLLFFEIVPISAGPQKPQKLTASKIKY